MILRTPLALALAIAACVPAARADVASALMVDGRERTYRVHEPAPARAGALPVVIVLHGGGGNADNAARTVQMEGRADRDGFLVVYPEGTGLMGGRLLTWNAWNCCGYGVKTGVDDVGFVRALIQRLAHDYSVDRKRVYVTGLSNGAMLAYRLACELADEIAAIAPVAGALNTDACTPKQPVSVIAFHGRDDRYVRYDGGAGGGYIPGSVTRVDRSVVHAMSTWARIDGCAAAAPRESRGHVTRDGYRDCRNGTEVVVYTIAAQGHAWPGGTPGIRNGNVDAPTREISATDLMVDFFLAHPKA